MRKETRLRGGVERCLGDRDVGHGGVHRGGGDKREGLLVFLVHRVLRGWMREKRVCEIALFLPVASPTNGIAALMPSRVT